MIEALNGWKLMSTIVIYFHNINFRSTTDRQTKNTPPPELQKIYIYVYIFHKPVVGPKDQFQQEYYYLR